MNILQSSAEHLAPPTEFRPVTFYCYPSVKKYKSGSGREKDAEEQQRGAFHWNEFSVKHSYEKLCQSQKQMSTLLYHYAWKEEPIICIFLQ